VSHRHDYTYGLDLRNFVGIISGCMHSLQESKSKFIVFNCPTVVLIIAAGLAVVGRRT
jgi:hypothetical protein